MERAVANLVRNAVSVSPRGSAVRVAIDTVVHDDGRRYARVDVVDDGPGVGEDVAKRSFQRFVMRRIAAQAQKGIPRSSTKEARARARSSGSARNVDLYCLTSVRNAFTVAA